MDRNRYADLLRVAAIGAVVYGHWILTDVTYRHGQLSGLDALDYIGWGRWVTLAMQVMPVFLPPRPEPTLAPAPPPGRRAA